YSSSGCGLAPAVRRQLLALMQVLTGKRTDPSEGDETAKPPGAAEAGTHPEAASTTAASGRGSAQAALPRFPWRDRLASKRALRAINDVPRGAAALTARGGQTATYAPRASG